LREGFQMLVKGEFHTALLCALRLVKRGFLQKDVKEVEDKQKVYRLKQTYTLTDKGKKLYEALQDNSRNPSSYVISPPARQIYHRTRWRLLAP